MKPGKNNRKYKFIFPLVTAAAVTAGSFSAVTAAEVQGPVAPSTGSATTNQSEPAPNTNATASDQAEPAPDTNATASDHAEPAPGTTSANQASDGQGTLSPPSDNSKSSVFGQASSVEAPTDEKLSSLLTQLQDRLPVSNGSWSVYVRDLYNESEGSVNDHSMQAASLIKLYIMGAVYENYDTLISQYGQQQVDSNLYSMITVSDNDAANALTSYLGGGDSSAGMTVVNDFCSTHGFNNTHMGRLLLQSNAYDDNYTSVADCGHLLYGIYSGNSSEYPYADSMFDLLAAQTRRNKIPAQMPSDAKTANKTGELDNVENDAGIVYDVDNELILVFMSENLSECGSAQNTIASLSRQIFDYYNPAS